MSKKQPITWRTDKRKVKDLLPYDKNPRVITEKQIADLKRSLTKFSLAEIPAVNTDGTLVAGNQRVKVLMLMGKGETLIDVRVPSRKLSEAEFKDYLITSNKSGGDFDYDILARDFNMEELSTAGFDDVDLSKIFDSRSDKKEETWDEEKEMKKAKATKIKLGDVYMLGRHRLICGDATDTETVKKLMDGAKADLVNQDPPFNIDLSYEKGVGGEKTKKNYGGIVKDNLSDEAYAEFIRKMMKNAMAVTKSNSHWAWWCDERYVWLFQNLYKELGINAKRLLIWVKNNSSPTPHVAFNKATEYIVYGTLGSPYLSKHVTTANEIINHDTTTGNELLEELTNLILAKRLASNLYEHPTEKSPQVHYKIIKRCTKVNDIVLDLTAGSGSIMTACQQLGRTAYMCEMSPIFCQLIINRFKQISNEEVRKLN